MSEHDLYFGHLSDIGLQSRMGFLYFICAPELKRIKIGITSQTIMERLKGLQTGSPTPLTVAGYCYFQNYEKVERKLHDIFVGVNAKVGGQSFSKEWFDMHPLLMAFIWNYSHNIVNANVFGVEDMRVDPLLFPDTLLRMMKTKTLIDWEEMESGLSIVGNRKLKLAEYRKYE